MSIQIPTWMVEQFKQNVHVMSQQKGSRLLRTVRTDGDIVGERVHFDRIGSSAAQRITTRHADTPLMNTPHTRRSAVMYDYDWGDLVDKADKLKTINDPTNYYAQMMMYALGRAQDDEIISAMFGTAYGGKDGTTSSTFPAAQQVAVNDHTYDGGSGDVGLTISKLLVAKKILWANDVDEDAPMYCALSANELASLLYTTEVKSVEYNAVKALYEGTVTRFMGIEFVRTQRLPTDSAGDRKVAVYTANAIGCGIPQNIEADIGPRRDKRNAIQVYGSMSIGAVRVEDEQIVEIACDP